MAAPPTARGELPNFYELDPLRFQALCRDLYQVEPEIDTAEVFGVPGQGQHGVDIVATRRDTGIDVGQCKCIKADSLTPAAVRKASEEFLKHLDYWKERDVKRFVLFVASDASRAKIQDEHLKQREYFARIGIEYALWGASTIANKLRPQPGITSTYFDDRWKDILCGTALSGFPRESIVIDTLLRTQVEALAGHVSSAAEAEIEALRNVWRRGRRSEVVEGISRLHETTRWQAFPSALKATVLRFEGHLALENEDLQRARRFADESSALNPAGSVRLRALIARAENQPDQALALLTEASDVETRTLRAALLIEGGQTSEAFSVLEQLTGHAETHRLRALIFTMQRDLARARLEVEKAAELAPTWHAILYTRVVINYLSGLSPAVLPQHIPPWPEPQDWQFIKTDDRSRGFFGVAAATVAQIETEAEATSEERRVYEAWHLGSLANDPERRDEATEYCRDVLSRDPDNYRVLSWALARRLNVDLSEPERRLRELIANAQASPPDVIALALLRIQQRDFVSAKSLFEENRSLFNDAGAIDLWELWMAQVSAANTETPSFTDAAAPSDRPELPETILTKLRAAGRVTGKWEPLIAELRKRADSGDLRATFELCDLLFSVQQWDEALPFARIIIEKIGTPDSLMLGCTVLYNAGYYDECLKYLDSHRDNFPHSAFPAHAQRLRLAAQRKLGLLPAATAAAEDLFRREHSTANFLLLADIYFERGDFAALVVLVRMHEQFEDLSTVDLLRHSLRVAAEDSLIAVSMWRRAAEKGFRDEEVPSALEVGFKLGLDRELRSLVHRLAGLAAGPEQYVRQVNLDELREHLLARRGDIERTYRMYRAGEIPIHFAAEALGRSLVSWYHRAPAMNVAAGRSALGPTFTRSGWRVGRSITLDPDVTPRLHADLTAILMASHLGVLEKIEAVFRPIVLPHLSVVALAAMRDSARPGQPARAEALRTVQDLVDRSFIRLCDEVVPDQNTFPILPFDFRTAQMLTLAKRKGWLFADLLPLTGDDGRPVMKVPEHENLLRTAQTLVDALHSLAEISSEKRMAALEALGPEHGQPTNREVPRDATVLCSAGVLELLASGGILEETSRAFHLCLTRSEFESFIAEALRGFQTAVEDAAWLTSLIARINLGLQSGKYQLLPDIAIKAKAESNVAKNSLPAKCLLDLLQFPPSAGSVIWVDDRWVNGFAHRDGLPVVDTFDIMHMLFDRGLIPQSELTRFTRHLRESDLRIFSLDEDEIKEMAQLANIKAGELIEGKELRTLRRQYSLMLVDGDALRVTPKDQGLPLEWPFLLRSGASVIHAVVELWQTNEIREARPRAEWILRNLYTPDRGRAFTKAERSADVDHHIEALTLSTFISHTISFDLAPAGRQARRGYLQWIHHRLLRMRFEADPHLAATTLDTFKATILQSMDGSKAVKKHAHAAVALVRELILDLPDDIGAKLSEDKGFLRRLGLSRLSALRIGQHHVDAEELWKSATTVLKTSVAMPLQTESGAMTIKVIKESGVQQLVVEDTAARMHYVLSDVVGLLSDSVAERELALRGIAGQFDLTRSATEEAIARIASQGNPTERLMEVAGLRESSALNAYLELEVKLKEQQPVTDTDFVPEDIQIILQHLRLQDSAERPLAEKLESAAATLLDDVGLEQTIERFAGLPVSLPAAILSTIDALSPESRHLLLKRLARALTKSPLGTVHVARLLARYASDRPSYGRYFRASLRNAVLNSGDNRFEAWLKVLRVTANDLCYVDKFRHLPTDIQLCLVWAHSDRIFRILANAHADMNWVRNRFGSRSARLPAEVGFAGEAYAIDAAHPARISGLAFALAGCAYASDQGAFLDDALRTVISDFVEADPSRIVGVMRDVSLNPDALNSILRRDGRAAWLSVFTTAVQERISPAVLRPQLAAAIEGIKSGQADIGEWFILNAIAHDAPLPDDLVPNLSEALLKTNLTSLHGKNRSGALLAAIVAAQHAGRLGEAVIHQIRSELVALAKAWSVDSNALASEVEDAGGVLLSAAFYLFSRAKIDDDVNRYAEIAQLLDELAQQWPALLDRAQLLVDRLIEGLPNADSRWLWQLQVKLRAAR